VVKEKKRKSTPHPATPESKRIRNIETYDGGRGDSRTPPTMSTPVVKRGFTPSPLMAPPPSRTVPLAANIFKPQSTASRNLGQDEMEMKALRKKVDTLINAQESTMAQVKQLATQNRMVLRNQEGIVGLVHAIMTQSGMDLGDLLKKFEFMGEKAEDASK
jgi:hypothetical protein